MKKILTLSLIFLASVNAYCQEVKLSPDNIDYVVKEMTINEKIDLLVGCGAGWGNVDAKFPGTAGWTAAIPRLGIPSIYFADGPMGVNMDKTREYDAADYSCTFFLSGSTLACSWDVDAADRIGHAIGYELKHRGLDVILGPGANLHRNILCGRNQEYFSEDPVLSGRLAAAWIRGAESNGIATSLKHFAANNQETNRKENDSRISERALRELYLKNFEIAVKEGNPSTVMGSYNYINGVHACENKWLLDDVLRNEWGFKGVVISDWDGVLRQDDAVRATCDLIEPGTEEDKKAILEALMDGILTEKDIDRNVHHILELVVKSPSYQDYQYDNNIDRESHRRLLRQVASESMVLLRNERNALPLSPCKVALYGTASYDFVPGNMGVNGVNNGTYHVSLVQGLRESGFEVFNPVLREYTDYIPSRKQEIASAYPPMYTQFYRFPSPEEIIPGQKQNDQMKSTAALTLNLGVSQGQDTRYIPIEEQVRNNAAAIITLSRRTGEAFDRTSSEFYLTESEQKLIDVISLEYHKASKPVIVLLNVPSPVEVVSWRDKVDAILLVGQPGERAGESIADVLSGKVNPSGHLADTWPVDYGDALSDNSFPSDYGQKVQDLVLPRKDRDRELERNVDYTDYDEDIYMGYRYFSTFDKPVAYPFGFGLSYTSFEYSDARIIPCDDGFEVSVVVTNAGNAVGREVVQLYVSAPKGKLDKPSKELKAFSKTKNLSPGESERVSMRVSDYDLASFNEKKSQWEAASGGYMVLLGSNVETIRAQCNYAIKKTKIF